MRQLIVLTFIYLGVVAYFIWQDMDASRPDTPRYVELAESICDKTENRLKIIDQSASSCAVLMANEDYSWRKFDDNDFKPNY